MVTDQSLWDRFVSYDNFFLAWQRTSNCSSRMIRDELGMEVFSYNLQANLEDLIRRVGVEDFPYEPLPDHKVYVPKASTTLRTMSMLSVPDLIVYQAMVNVIADETHPRLVSHENQHVWGNLYAGPESRWMLKPWKQQYRRYVDYIERMYKEGNPWIASTDVVAFYDTVDHERLLGLVHNGRVADERFKKLFRKCLQAWSMHTVSVPMSRGIPQGSNASDYLANLYLYDIDRIMIASGYHYTRYVDDVRILGPDKETVQRGLILFDLELKRAGLVAQVSKTSVHEIEDIDKEITRMRFAITDPEGNGTLVLVEVASLPTSEQAESSVQSHLHQTPTDFVDSQSDTPNAEADSDEDGDKDSSATKISSQDPPDTQLLQEQLRQAFLDAIPLLDDPEKSREADSTIAFCLFRLAPDPSIRTAALALLPRIPWRSEALTICLSRFTGDPEVEAGLRKFIAAHDVYSYHRAKALWALHQVAGAKRIAVACREWLANPRMDWYARLVAARILTEVPGQHAFFLETLRIEQENAVMAPEATSVLREQLAYGAFQRIRSPKKQAELFRILSEDRSPMLRRLGVYLLQRPECKVSWEELEPLHGSYKEFAEVIAAIGIAEDAPRRCLIANVMSAVYSVTLGLDDLRSLYGVVYQQAVHDLKTSMGFYRSAPNEYIDAFHHFVHLSIIAFYATALPAEANVYASDYGNLIARAPLKKLLPRAEGTFDKLGKLRNRVAHPVDHSTRTLSQRIKTREVDMLEKELRVALQEFFDVWIASLTVAPLPIPARATTTQADLSSASPSSCSYRWFMWMREAAVAHLAL
jgi:hypothetical protein